MDMKAPSLPAELTTITGYIDPCGTGEWGLQALRRAVEQYCGDEFVPMRVVVTETGEAQWLCEIDTVARNYAPTRDGTSVFDFRRRRTEREALFVTAMLVPTGIDCEVGGHAGDATPAARLLAAVSDTLIIHPNIVNASDINEQPDNALYVEGSLMCRLLMGTISLRRVRSNRILLITEPREDGSWAIDQVVNTANAARASLGAQCTKVVVLRCPLEMQMERSASGRAVGSISGMHELFDVLELEWGNYDAVGIATRIAAPGETSALLQSYFRGEGPNPWGGVEAALTHAISGRFGIPSAHAPTLEDVSLREECFGRVDPRKAAESISTSFLYCVIKGLYRAPGVVLGWDGSYSPDLVSAEDVSCLVVPDGCIGLPVIAAASQGIPIVAVRGNRSMMRNNLGVLGIQEGKLISVSNYYEAAGVIAALRAGIAPAALNRPIPPLNVAEGR